MIHRADADAVLEDAGEQLERVRGLYEKSLREQEAPAALKTRIKNVVENQRSALEYLAHAIYERHGDGKGARSYFPVANVATEFPGLFDRFLPGVAATCPDAREAIKARQPYEPGFEWLRHLTLLTNENKHRRLTPQKRTETKTVETRGPRGGQVGYVDWLFEDPQLSALGTLERIQESLPRLVDDVVAALP